MNVLFVVGELHFEWDDQKAARNWKKHKLSFVEGASVFQDREALMLDDPDEFEDEVRFELLGYSNTRRMLVVVHVAREVHLRIVSVRPATAMERRLYEKRKS